MLELDLHQLGYWIVVTLVILAAPFLFVRGALVRDLLGERLSLSLLRLHEAPEPEEFDADLSAVLRVERLRADLARMQRLLATDDHMSAVRQLGNRLAYEQLWAQLRRDPELAAAVAGAPSTARLLPGRPSTAGRSLVRPATGPVTETLDIGWGSRRGR